ncbi:MAG: flavodoxin [Clostridiales bacterium]|jgi:flavodoxin|nr:flavodoxin [Clostridiales bacterium]
MSKNILVAYFSQTGNTKKLANMICDAVGGTLQDIGAGAAVDLDAYDTVFVGTPNWAGTVTEPVKKFLSAHDLSGKTVIPFCTHGMGGLQNVASDMAALCPNSKVLQSFAIKGVEVDSAPEKLRAWLDGLGYGALV